MEGGSVEPKSAFQEKVAVLSQKVLFKRKWEVAVLSQTVLFKRKWVFSPD